MGRSMAGRIYVEKVLIPSLNLDDIVIMDNLSSQKGRPVHQLIPFGRCQAVLLTKIFSD